MGSKNLQTRQSQKAKFVRDAEARKELLKKKGVPEDKIAKDSLYRKAKAKVKQAVAALSRISQLENQTKQLQEKKEQAKAAAEAARLEALTEGTKPKGKKKQADAKAEAARPESKAGKKPAKTKEGAKTKPK
jgi:hypothetical protein